MPPMTAKQIRYFGTPAQKAALRRKRGGSRSTRRATKARRVYPKRTTNMARKSKKGGSRRSKASIADLIVGANVAFQAGEPLMPVARAALAGDIPGAAAALPAAVKETASFKNLGQALGPVAALKLAKKFGIGRALGRFKVMGRRMV